MGAAVVSGVDAPPIFELSEHIFDPMALLVEEGVIGDGDSIGLMDADGDAALGEGGAEPIRVVALVGEKPLAWAGRATSAPRPCSHSSAPRLR